MINLPSLGVYISMGAYLSVLALILIYLSYNVISTRRSLKITLGTDNNSMVLRAMRAHANFCEYVPLAVILIFIVAQVTLPITLNTIKPMSASAHGLFLALVLGRLAHAYGMLAQETKAKPSFQMRLLGTGLTLGVIAFSVLILILSWIFAIAQANG